MQIKLHHTYNSSMGLVKVIGTFIQKPSWTRMVQVRVVGSTRGFFEIPAIELEQYNMV